MLKALESGICVLFHAPSCRNEFIPSNGVATPLNMFVVIRPLFIFAPAFTLPFVCPVNILLAKSTSSEPDN
jgi:hypothetical protein